MSKAKDEAERIIEMFSCVGLQQREEALACAIIHVEGILSCQYDLPSRGFYNHWKEVLTILNNK